MPDSKYYYEAHITIEPVFNGRLEEFTTIANTYNFHVADLLMQKRKEDTPTRSKYDTFCTGRHKNFDVIKQAVIDLITCLRREGFKVWRYKIEDTILDSRIEDELSLLEGEYDTIRSNN